jgi:hypothetical protein
MHHMLQMMEQFSVNSMNQCNRMTIMMMTKIFFDVGDSEIFFRIEMYIILVCLFINIQYLQLLFSFMSSSFILWNFLYYMIVV